MENFRKLPAILMALLIGITVLSGGVASYADENIIRVPEDYGTIQMAVDAAPPGFTIIVGPGEWYGANVTKAVTIRGIGAVIANGDPFDNDPTINLGFFLGPLSSGATITGFTFTVNLPILGRDVDDVTVYHNIMTKPIQGVTCTNGKGWVITYNEICGINITTLAYMGIGIYIVANPSTTPTPIASGNLVAFNKISMDFPNPRPYPPVGILLDSDGGVVRDNKIVHNEVLMTGSGSWPILPPIAIGMLCEDPNVGSLLFDNKIGFNDLRGSTLEIVGYPWGSAFWEYNDIYRNLGRNRAYDGYKGNIFKLPF